MADLVLPDFRSHPVYLDTHLGLGLFFVNPTDVFFLIASKILKGISIQPTEIYFFIMYNITGVFLIRMSFIKFRSLD